MCGVEMNPLCCIAPVSVERDRGNPAQRQLGFESDVKNVNFGSKPSFSTQASSVGTDLDGLSANVNHEVEDVVVEPRDSKGYCGNGGGSGGVAGILYKWVNYGKGWRARWFVLEDGVLSYYKIHGPDKIAMSPSREKGVKVIGEESLSYVKKANWNSKLGSYAKQWKPFGEIHLKVCSDLSYPSIQTEYNYSFDPIHLIPSVWFSSLMNYNCSIMVFILLLDV